MKVTVRNGKFEKALRIFKRNSKEILQEVRARQFYEKPSDRKRKEKLAGIARANKESK